MDIKWQEDWAEVLAFGFLVLGVVISILLQNPLFTYITIILAGFLSGRIYYTIRYKEPILPFLLVIFGFLLGYLIGSFWTSRLLVLLFFLASFYGSYYLHREKILVIFKSEDFLK